MKRNLSCIAALSIVFLLFVVLSGCGTQEEKTIAKNDGDTKTVKNELSVKKDTGYFTITPTAVSEYKKRDVAEKKPPKQVTQIKLTVENTDSVEHGIGSLDFKAFDQNGKELKSYGYAASIGDIISTEKLLKSSVYFIGGKEDIYRLEYRNPVTNKKVKWMLTQNK